MTTDPKENINPFNPDFDEEAERARLRPVEKGGVPSPEIQQAFVNWIDETRQQNRMGGSFNIQPEKLFYGDLEQSGPGLFPKRKFKRVYYKHPSGAKFSGSDIQVELLMSTEEDEVSFAHIDRYGEAPNFRDDRPERISVTFMPKPPDQTAELDFEQISIGAQFEGRKLGVHYGETGSIATVSFRLRGMRDEVQASDPPSRFDIRISELIQTGKASFRVGKSEYRASYDRQTEQIKLTRMESGEVKDVVTLPRQIDGKQKFDELFPKPFLDDIFGASTEQDRTWKDFHLETFGIKWDRPTPNPT